MDLPGQPALTTPSAATSRDLPTPDARSRSEPTPTTSSSDAGTLAKWAAAGCVVIISCSPTARRAHGMSDADQKALDRAAARRAAGSGRRVGAKGEVVFLGRVDGELETTLALRGEVAYWIRALQPDVVLGHDPWRRYRLHPDHRHAGFLTVDGIVAARDPFFFPEHGVSASPARRPCCSSRPTNPTTSRT